jgi:IS5 family transposase
MDQHTWQKRIREPAEKPLSIRWLGVLHSRLANIKALPGAPYDGHTLATVLPELEQQIGVHLERIVADAGYRGHNAADKHRLKVFDSGQKRGVTDQIKRQLRRRAAVEPVIRHLKAEHRMGRNYLAHRQGDAINAILAAAG